MTIIEQIKAEIKRLKATNPSEYNYQNAEGYVWALYDILSFLSTLESENPMNQDELEKELDRYLHGEFQQTAGGNFNNYFQVARHFYDIGCRRTAEKYDEIEYNRQRAEESVPNDLEEELMDWCGKFNPSIREEIQSTAYHFAGWQKEQDDKEQADLFTIVALDAAQRAKEQMMKKAVEGKIIFLFNGDVAINIGDVDEYNLGDKVRIIVVKED